MTKDLCFSVADSKKYYDCSIRVLDCSFKVVSHSQSVGWKRKGLVNIALAERTQHLIDDSRDDSFEIVGWSL